ncbi:hypothetical protein CA54_49410 [Symmachiella macrocystis]|uniref:Uncharacterized protein n=1 Tax=Symmachiella macrocystis TaxID=2527985 RepID=A0A5C6BEJ2_9PLAN|nr:hypothetical protein CA54_49410 [Symmachiella macrocystis]
MWARPSCAGSRKTRTFIRRLVNLPIGSCVLEEFHLPFSLVVVESFHVRGASVAPVTGVRSWIQRTQFRWLSRQLRLPIRLIREAPIIGSAFATI